MEIENTPLFLPHPKQKGKTSSKRKLLEQKKKMLLIRKNLNSEKLGK